MKDNFIKIFLILFTGSLLFLSSFLITYTLLSEYSSTFNLNKENLLEKAPRAYIIQSGSMEPSIKTGSLVISKKVKNYLQGDVITFAPNGNFSKLITHRIIFKLYPDGPDSPPKYITGGDANEDFDTWEVKDEYIVGKVFISLPYLGYIANYAKTPFGFIIFVIVPSTIIIYEEIRSLLNEVKRLFNRLFFNIRALFKKSKKSEAFYLTYPNNFANQKGSDDSEKNSIAKVSIILPILGASIVFIGLTASFFSDVETSIGNTIKAGDWSTSSHPTELCGDKVDNDGDTNIDFEDSDCKIVINEVYYRVSETHKINNSEAGSEWVELYNPTSNTIDLTGWSIEDNVSCDAFPETLKLSPYQFAIVTPHTESDFRSIWVSVPSGVLFIQSPTAIGNGLANNDELILKNGDCSSTSIIDHISWGSNTNAFNPPIPVTQIGVSSERSPDGKDTNTNSDFIYSDPPTPGI